MDDEDDLADEPVEVTGGDPFPVGIEADKSSETDSYDEDTPADRPIDIRDPTSADDWPISDPVTQSTVPTEPSPSTTPSPATTDKPKTGTGAGGGSSVGDNSGNGEELGKVAPETMTDEPSDSSSGGAGGNGNGKKPTWTPPKRDNNSWERKSDASSNSKSSKDRGSQQPSVEKQLQEIRDRRWITPNNPSRPIETAPPSLNPYDPNRPGQGDWSPSIELQPNIIDDKRINPKTGREESQSTAVGASVKLPGPYDRTYKHRDPPKLTDDEKPKYPIQEPSAPPPKRLSGEMLEVENDWIRSGDEHAFHKRHGNRPTDPDKAKEWDQAKDKALLEFLIKERAERKGRDGN
jgi:hypothetical protein